MVKISHTLLIGMIILPLFSMLSRCEKPVSQEYGFLEGLIRIGPICPVETDPPSPECMPTAETFNAYPIGVWSADGTEKILVLSPALDGSFKVKLHPGQYLVRLDRVSTIGGSNLPIEVGINALEKTILDIDIDTGIR